MQKVNQILKPYLLENEKKECCDKYASGQGYRRMKIVSFTGKT